MTSRTLVEGLLRRVRPPKPRLFAWKKSATRRAVMSRQRAFAAKLSRRPNAAGHLSGDRLTALPMVHRRRR